MDIAAELSHANLHGLSSYLDPCMPANNLVLLLAWQLPPDCCDLATCVTMRDVHHSCTTRMHGATCRSCGTASGIMQIKTKVHCPSVPLAKGRAVVYVVKHAMASMAAHRAWHGWVGLA